MTNLSVFELFININNTVIELKQSSFIFVSMKQFILFTLFSIRCCGHREPVFAQSQRSAGPPRLNS